MDKIKIKLKRVEEYSLFHNSREDARTLAKYCNVLKEKVNELVDENNHLKARIKRIESLLESTQPTNKP